jgi:hypothetical protein
MRFSKTAVGGSALEGVLLRRRHSLLPCPAKLQALLCFFNVLFGSHRRCSVHDILLSGKWVSVFPRWVTDKLVVGSGSAWLRMIFGELNGEAQIFSVGFVGLVVGKDRLYWKRIKLSFMSDFE